MTMQIFDFAKWEQHRSPWKYVEQLTSLPVSHTVRSVMLPLLWIIVVSLLIGLSFEVADHHLVPKWLALPRLSPAGARLARQRRHGEGCENFMQWLCCMLSAFACEAYSVDSHIQLQASDACGTLLADNTRRMCSDGAIDNHVLCAVIAARVSHQQLI
jgi:hypothetical protein